MENNAHTNAKAEEKGRSRRDKEPEISEDNNCSASENLSVQELVQEIESKFNSLHNSQHVTPDYCIFRIPGKISDENSAPYRHRYAVIGPLVYHFYLSAHGEEEKQRYLAAFLLRAHPNTSLIDFITLIKGSLAKIRGCYEKLYYRNWDDSSNKPRQYKRACTESDPLLLIRTILVDAGFILELLLRAYSKEWRVENDLIFAKSGTIHDLKRDLMLLEQQLPFFLLRDMYELAFAGYPNYPSFLHLTCHFFSHYYNQSISIDDVLSPNNPHTFEYRSKLKDAKHFTDLIRTFQQPYPFQKHQHCSINNEDHQSHYGKWILRGGKHFMHLISSQKPEPEGILEEGKLQQQQGEYLYSAVLLREAGVKFKVSLSTCLFDIEFDEKNGELKIPPLKVDDSTESFYGNLMVWEQCYYPNDTFICDYIFLMGYLIKSAEDVGILVRRRIMINQLGSPKAIVKMFNNLCKYIDVEKNNRYSSLFMKLNAFNAVPHHSWVAILKHQYFSSLWRGVATVAAIILLVLTMIQTIIAILSL
ncbi:hypothetical protein Golax_000035 [Gossypium laxum]|uniref:Uncharacterized protein n=1 Tax=Gossypium laxum TaxID=34288 RepID=A0A7J9AY90_9ROSI|nr:hypothetical protein [Gossypium laxum]